MTAITLHTLKHIGCCETFWIVFLHHNFIFIFSFDYFSFMWKIEIDSIKKAISSAMYYANMRKGKKYTVN